MSDLKFKKNTSRKVEDLLERASELALTSKERYRHGAIITLNGNVISSGVNRRVNNPRICDNPKEEAGLHAEVAAIKSAGKTNLNGATIFVARVLKDNSQAMSKPCIYCQKSLREVGVKKVYYTIDSEMDL